MTHDEQVALAARLEKAQEIERKISKARHAVNHIKDHGVVAIQSLTSRDPITADTLEMDGAGFRSTITLHILNGLREHIEALQGEYSAL